MVTLSSLAVDLDLFVLDGPCSPYQPFCNYFGDTQVTFPIKPDRVYTIYVDGYQGAVGEFTLKVSCPISYSYIPLVELVR
jgi:hypothetical protein